jgi:hypothetical protein
MKLCHGKPMSIRASREALAAVTGARSRHPVLLVCCSIHASAMPANGKANEHNLNLTIKSGLGGLIIRIPGK